MEEGIDHPHGDLERWSEFLVREEKKKRSKALLGRVSLYE